MLTFDPHSFFIYFFNKKGKINPFPCLCWQVPDLRGTDLHPLHLHLLRHDCHHDAPEEAGLSYGHQRPFHALQVLFLYSPNRPFFFITNRISTIANAKLGQSSPLLQCCGGGCQQGRQKTWHVDYKMYVPASLQLCSWWPSGSSGCGTRRHWGGNTQVSSTSRSPAPSTPSGCSGRPSHDATPPSGPTWFISLSVSSVSHPLTFSHCLLKELNAKLRERTDNSC